ncbi:peptide/nickel transport system permease protein [Microbacterium trichothecenolyticum]|uniref:Peptide/nickel transport system permease protein n=2 Tax=Microbacterium trichothecenolyticum TaxID=69370 RepID=A0ABU0TQ07_MICTR|nr:peptide/nickel transport system permease protein [Microbacterium trichothecenolyticum]
MRFVVTRVVLMIPVLIGVVTVTFLLMHLTPGDPALAYLGQKAGPEALAALRHAWGLDRPLWVQYLQFAGGLLRGDFGTSMYFKQPTAELISARLPVTLELTAMTAVLIVVIAVPAATLAAARQGRAADSLLQLGASAGLGMPQFWVASMLVLVLSLQLGLFPAAGYGDTPLSQFVSLILPALTLAISAAPLVFRSLRSSMIDALDSEYVAFAEAKGLRRFRVLSGYALRNGAISAVTILGVNVGAIIGGTLVVESVFSLPGLGSLMMQGILNRDFPVVQCTTLVFAVLVVLIYLGTDILHRLLDPRVRNAA